MTEIVVEQSFRVDCERFDTLEAAENYVRFLKFKAKVVELKNKLSQHRILSPHFHPSVNDLSSENLDSLLQLAQDITDFYSLVKGDKNA